jgi:hypothetical protein
VSRRGFHHCDHVTADEVASLRHGHARIWKTEGRKESSSTRHVANYSIELISIFTRPVF